MCVIPFKPTLEEKVVRKVKMVNEMHSTDNKYEQCSNKTEDLRNLK